MKKTLPLSLVIGALIVLAGANHAGTKKQKLSPTVLEALEPIFNDAQAVAITRYKGRNRFFVLHSDSLAIYNDEYKFIAKVEINYNYYPCILAADTQGWAYLANSSADEVMIINPDGQVASRFTVFRPLSITPLSDGNIAIASPAERKLIQVYDRSGRRLRSIGKPKVFDSANTAQNDFFNRGEVIADSSDNIYFVTKYALAPTIEKFSPSGKLLFETAIEGDAIRVQTEAGRRLQANKSQAQAGGIVITNSATVNVETGSLLVCMNGTSRSGIVYEYSSQGEKLREFSFRVKPDSRNIVTLTGAKGLAAGGQWIYVLTHDGVVYRFNKDVSASELTPQEGDPAATCDAQPWPDCAFNCPAGSPTATVGCKAALQASIADGQIPVGQTCSQVLPGTGTPPKPNGGCIATVTTCVIDNGRRILTTHSANLDCEPPRYSCSNGNCVPDPAGLYTTSNCNNSCTSGNGDCALCQSKR